MVMDESRDDPVDIVEPRRRDRGKDAAWIRAFLEAAPVGVLAIPGGDRPHVNSNLFVYDDESRVIYMHTARTGAMPDALAEPVSVTFSASVMGRLLPADEALEFSVEYAGVVVYGRGRTVTDAEEAERALQMLLDRYAPHLRPGRDYRPITPDELKRTAVYRIDIEAWSGKEKFVEPDFPGAFTMDQPAVPFRPDGD